jgi:hypothetical protein
MVAERAKAIEEGLEVDGERWLTALPEGWTLVQLLTEPALRKEGRVLNHCIGSPQQPYLRAVVNGRAKAWSVRDSTGEPKITIYSAPPYNHAEQAKGYSNRPVGYSGEEVRRLYGATREAQVEMIAKGRVKPRWAEMTAVEAALVFLKINDVGSDMRYIYEHDVEFRTAVRARIAEIEEEKARGQRARRCR